MAERANGAPWGEKTFTLGDEVMPAKPGMPTATRKPRETQNKKKKKKKGKPDDDEEKEEEEKKKETKKKRKNNKTNKKGKGGMQERVRFVGCCSNSVLFS